MEEDKKVNELEGKKIDDVQAGEAAGGYDSGDKWIFERDSAAYARCGITYEKNFWSKDKYSIYGVYITADEADRIYDETFKVGHLLSKEELHDLGIHGF